MTDILVDQAALRAQVQQKYREVALEPGASFHFHTAAPWPRDWAAPPPRSTDCPTRLSSPSPE
jgi:hypothetical protein